MKISCIYIIKSQVKPDKFYIGSAVNFCDRKKSHIFSLNKLKHCNSPLQNHVNKYGIADLSFEILERVSDKTKLIEREQYYIDLMNPNFNICKVAGSPLGNKLSDETKLKMSKARKRIMTPEMRKTISEFHKGRKHSEETKLKISLKNTGKKRSNVARENISKAMKERENTDKAISGRIVSEETRLKLSLWQKGVKKDHSFMMKCWETRKRNQLLKKSA